MLAELNESQINLLTDDASPSMLDVILNKRKSPLRLIDFKNYLEYKHCDENLLFLLNINKIFKILDTNLDKRNEFLSEIELLFADFIIDESKNQVNLCNSSRKIAINGKIELLEMLNNSNWNLIREKFLSIIEPSMKEIEGLLLSDQFPGFIKQATRINLSTMETRRRFIIGNIFLLIGIVTTLILWLGIEDVKESSYYRIVTFIPYFSSISMLASGYRSL